MNQDSWNLNIRIKNEPALVKPEYLDQEWTKTHKTYTSGSRMNQDSKNLNIGFKNEPWFVKPKHRDQEQKQTEQRTRTQSLNSSIQYIPQRQSTFPWGQSTCGMLEWPPQTRHNLSLPKINPRRIANP